MQKQIFMTEEQRKETEIRLSNDYIAEIKTAIWVDYFDAYRVTIEFDSEEDLKRFCDIYGYEINNLNSDFLSEKEGSST